MPDRFDYDQPENQRKLDLVEELLKLAADAGLSLTHLAMALVLEHPAVTSAIIGPRTMEQLTDLLAGADARLDDEVLDGSTSSCRPAPTSTRPTRDTHRRPWGGEREESETMRLRVFVGGVALALALAVCGGGDDSGSNGIDNPVIGGGDDQVTLPGGDDTPTPGGDDGAAKDPDGLTTLEPEEVCALVPDDVIEDALGGSISGRRTG